MSNRATVQYHPENIDDDSRVWRISGNPGDDALAHINIGPIITFELNDSTQPVGATSELWLHRQPRRDLSIDRLILTELFGEQAASLIGRSPDQWGGGVEVVDDFYGIAEKEVPVEVKNPQLARILGGLATIDFIRTERRHPYSFTEEKKQEMIQRAIELDGIVTDQAKSLIEFHERVQAAEDMFFLQNPARTEEELNIEEDQLHAQLTEWLPLYGLQSWIDYRKRVIDKS